MQVNCDIELPPPVAVLTTPAAIQFTLIDPSHLAAVAWSLP